MDVDKYCRLGISLVGMEALSDRHPGEITDATTTSDVCHAVLKPATVPAGWVDEVSPKRFWPPNISVHYRARSRNLSHAMPCY